MSYRPLNAKPLVTILNAHEFPPTALRFNPSTSLLLSGSADNSVRVIQVPQSFEGSGVMSTFAVYVVLALLVLLAGLLVQRGL